MIKSKIKEIIKLYKDGISTIHLEEI